MAEMGLNQALNHTKELVKNQQAAVRAENSGMGSASARAAAATDRANMALDIHIRAMPKEQLRAVIIHLVVDRDEPK